TPRVGPDRPGPRSSPPFDRRDRPLSYRSRGATRRLGRPTEPSVSWELPPQPCRGHSASASMLADCLLESAFPAGPPEPEAAWPAAASARRAPANRVPTGPRTAALAPPLHVVRRAWPVHPPTPSALSSLLARPVPPFAAPPPRAFARWLHLDTASGRRLALAVSRSFADLANSSHKQARRRTRKTKSVS